MGPLSTNSIFDEISRRCLFSLESEYLISSDYLIGTLEARWLSGLSGPGSNPAGAESFSTINIVPL